MITEFFLWLVQANLLNQVTLNLSLSNLVSLTYIASIKRSWHFALAFFVCDSLSMSNMFGSFDKMIELKEYKIKITEEHFVLVDLVAVYMLLFWLIMASVWAACIKERARQSNSKSLQAWCCIMITFLILMALDGFFNTYDETYIYTHYESIILCIHVCIVLSLYKPTTIIDALVDKLRNLTRILLHNYNFYVVWYTFKQQFTRI